MLITLVILLFIAVYLFDYQPVLKKAGTKEKILHGTFMAISFCILALHSLNIPIPSPTTSIESMVHALFGV